jgi:C4-dicarboxylate transporter
MHILTTQIKMYSLMIFTKLVSCIISVQIKKEHNQHLKISDAVLISCTPTQLITVFAP